MSAAPDHGDADPELVAALASGDPMRILPVLQEARLLVGVMAIPGEEQASEGEMALALLEAGSGERALPAFTCLDALTAWNREARPVPRPAREVITYAVAESLSAVVLDPGSPHAWTLWCEQLIAPPAAATEPTAARQGGRWWRRWRWRRTPG